MAGGGKELSPLRFLSEGGEGGGRRASLIAELRRLQRNQLPERSAGAEPETACELCGGSVAADHRHLLQLEERRIVCVCEVCWAKRSGDAEFRPTGSRVVWLDGFAFDDELWAAFGLPIGLAFFFLSGAARRVIALYPSPAGATESELDLGPWRELVAANPVLDSLEPDAEALIVNRIGEPPQHVIAPIDDCYRLVGLIRSRWQGVSGGAAVEEALPTFFDELRRRAEGRRAGGR